MAGLPTHTHHSEYADPVMRVPSPTSSVGTTYGPDQTSYSDSEFQLSDVAFARKCDAAIALNMPRSEEVEANKDPLLTIRGADDLPRAITEEDLEDPTNPAIQMRYKKVLEDLRAEVEKLRENELFEQILLRGSKAAMDVQPVTNDIDSLMRSMMGPGMNLNAGPHMGKTSPPTGTMNLVASTAEAGIDDGPWNNWGQPSETERQFSLLSTDNMLSGMTAGKRSRNGTTRKA